MERTQAHRHIELATPLGKDVLLLRGFSITEELGRPFSISLDLISQQQDIPADDIIGQNVTVRLNLRDREPRFFNGYVSRFVRTHTLDPMAQFEAVVVPWIWFLTRTSDCRIFQAMRVPDIIRQVMAEHGFSDVESRLYGNYEPWEYCVQYRESDFDFVHRLMEQEGIYYYFRHDNGEHMLVLADSLDSHEPYPGYEEIPYRVPGAHGATEHFSDWATEYRLMPGVYAHSDFDFQNPTKELLARSKVDRSHAASEFEIYDYPGEFTDLARGERYARARIEAYQGRHEVFSGSGLARGVSAGFVFKLTDFPLERLCRKYLITSAALSARTNAFDSQPGGTGESFGCSLTAMDPKLPFRLPLATPKPTVHGPQTALVVGPAGEEIYTDEYGRVKVQFHWDRYGQADENSSCWIRVGQVWAGKKWGGMFVPRIGQEVIVEFLEGDPDRPIITGRVYNGAAMPPYELPAGKTVSTVKSNSSKGGEGFNELRFEDQKDAEQVFLHAQKDQDVRVGNDCREHVGHDRHLIVKNDQFEQVESDKHLAVRGNQNEKIDGTISIEAGADLQEKVGQKVAVEAGQEIHLKAGMKVILEAGVQLTIRAGGGFVDLGPAGVTIQGTKVNINSGGSPGIGTGCSAESPQEAKEADSGQPGKVSDPPKPPEPPTPARYSPQATVLKMAAEVGAPLCERAGSDAGTEPSPESDREKTLQGLRDAIEKIDADIHRSRSKTSTTINKGVQQLLTQVR